jgi:tRNA threonylcarbamoyladenosine biosynthesis protein TsaB
MRRRLCLAIETTGPHLGLALHDLADRKFSCLVRFFESAPGQHSELLFPTLEKMLRSKRLRRDDLALVAVDHGPGSFTGVRVGIAAARGLAQTLALPIVGIGALEALAWQAAARIPGEAVVAAKIPALAGEAYFAVYRRGRGGAWSTVRQPVWTTEALIAKELSRLARTGAHIAFTRRAADPQVFPAGLMPHGFAAPDPSAIARLALARCGARPSARRFPVEKTVPVYLQPSWAERSRA